LFSWEKTTSGVLEAIGLRSIRTKIIAFALLATLIPSLTMGWLSYQNNRRAIDEKTVQELASLTSHASREIDLWIKERRYDLKVLSSSYEVTENIEKLNRPGQAGRDKAAALRRLEDYLGSVGGKFTDYRQLFVVDDQGNLLASSPAHSPAAGPARDWFARVREGETAFGEAYWDESLLAGVAVVAEPIRSTDGAFMGAMGAKVGFEGMNRILSGSVKEPSQELYLVTRRGEILISSADLGAAFMASRIDPAVANSLFGREKTPIEFRSFRGSESVGTLQAIPGLEWGIVAEKDRTAAYSAIVRMRNVTLALIFAVLIGIGMAGYLLGLTIVGPLGRLTQGAARVAGGDLEVALPVHGRSEVGYLTSVFNDMVARLRKFREENAAINQELRERNENLRELSITDGLTGLYNRTQLPEFLGKEMARSRRHRRSFAILMADMDHFKRFNDSHGHQAGDELLRRFGKVLKGCVRTCDLAARYGGEEFLILLTETGPEGGLAFAELLRRKVEEIRWEDGTVVTVSIGVASYPDNGDDVESIIRQADVALYLCKREGRNRVGLAETDREREGLPKISSG
jgi:diguanylate cyclase (GGDEF)-like protein